MVSNKCCVSGCSSSRKNGFKLFYVPNGKTPVTYTRSIYLYTVTSNLILGVKNRVSGGSSEEATEAVPPQIKENKKYNIYLIKYYIKSYYL
jgi:hypothetical protein